MGPEEPTTNDATEPAGPSTDEVAAAVPPVRRRRSQRLEPKPSLAPPLLSGRSLAPARPKGRLAVVREHPRIVGAATVVLVVLALVLGGKLLAESSADRAMRSRSEDLVQLMSAATPDDFLAFNAGVQREGSLAQLVRDTDGFVSLTADADLTFIRFQPSGWWAGFTERCLVAYVRPDGVTIETPKTACIRVTAPVD